MEWKPWIARRAKNVQGRRHHKITRTRLSLTLMTPDLLMHASNTQEPFHIKSVLQSQLIYVSRSIKIYKFEIIMQ